ncbi:patatin-like phospholipase family protein [Legionella jamestowniensis]|uniref:Esterase of the alpha-beta hydrolase superfamily protein n=1 Tax=Legionella jamestowniensis TaxID=455 RepID=A0A0W0UZH9_9GAMM|nr:patatin-like phospholipase family protein [Legionella jamestowniensis]KTD13274.1 esterase of the alpha-beta hydrolase superfamily protein [Legionella jamestowniensis]SFL77787.1 Patatin-like phospholipase [Legionella jamestowniensis DSM 19215]
MSVVNKKLLAKEYSFNLPQKPIRKLALRGGGAKGVVYGGAIQVLEEKGILREVDTIAGSSAGALTALMVAIGMTAKEITQVINNTDFNQFKDYAFSKAFSERGLCTGDKLSAYIQKVIKDYLPNKIDTAQSILKTSIQYHLQLLKEDKDTNSAFQGDIAKFLEGMEKEATVNDSVKAINQWLRSGFKINEKLQPPEFPLERLTEQFEKLQEINIDAVSFMDLELLNTCLGNAGVKRLIITGTNLTKKKLELFSDETTPFMPIWLAARISASFPLVFQTVKFKNETTGEINEYIDGGVGDNLPVRHLLHLRKDALLGKEEKINQTLSFAFAQQKNRQSGILATIINFIKYLASGRIDVAANTEELLDALKHDFSERVISLPVDITTLDFNIDLDKKLALQQEARIATQNTPAITKNVKIEGDILECFLMMSADQLEKINPEEYEEEDKEFIKKLKEKLLIEKSKEKEVFINLLTNIRFINTTLVSDSILAEEVLDLKNHYKALLDEIDKLLINSIELDSENSLQLEEKHKEKIYEKIKDVWFLEFTQLSANITTIMAGDNYSLKEIFSSDNRHREFFTNLQLDVIKKEAITVLIKAKVKPFQLESNVHLLEDAVEKLRKAHSREEMKEILINVQQDYYRRNLFSIIPGTNRFFKGSPDTSTAKALTSFIHKIDKIEPELSTDQTGETAVTGLR